MKLNWKSIGVDNLKQSPYIRVNFELYIVAGDNHAYNQHYDFNGTWTDKTAFPVSAKRVTSINYLDYNYTFGGSTAGAKIYKYDRNDDTWTNPLDMTNSTSYGNIYTYNNIGYYWGGNNTNTTISKIVFSTETWSAYGTSPEQNNGGGSGYENYAYAVGDYSTYTLAKKCELLTNTWSDITKTYDLSHNSLTELNGDIWNGGGWVSNPKNYNVKYTISSDSWTIKTVLPGNKNSGAFNSNIKNYYSAGYSGSVINTLYIYDSDSDSWTSGTVLNHSTRDVYGSVLNY